MRKVLFFVVCILFLLAGGAQADFSADLYLGGNFNNNIPLIVGGSPVSDGGGSIYQSTLNQVNLPWVYCVGRTTTVVVPGDYGNTYVTTTGQVYDNGFGGPTSLNPVPYAGQVAWLLGTYASSTGVDQVALQAAIWHEVDSNVSLSSSSSSWSNYQAYLAALGTNTGDITQFLWLSPSQDGSNFYQGLVTLNTVPIPSAIWLLGSGLMGLAGIRRRLRK